MNKKKNESVSQNDERDEAVSCDNDNKKEESYDSDFKVITKDDSYENENIKYEVTSYDLR